MKLNYIIPIAIYGYTLVTLDHLFALDYLAVILTFLGTATVIKAKIDLGDYHVWTGYKREDTKLVIKGIYRWIRHPLYLGIFIFILGGLSTVILRIKWFLLIPFSASLSYIMAFLIIASKKETAFLKEKFDDSFSRYCKQVHPFLPFQKYDD
jgi:protein-S-isoprenylcysteine O-methyltransferase Ste14